MEFPWEFAIEEKTKVFDLNGFKDLFLIKSYSDIEGFMRRSEYNEFRFINIEGEPVGTEPLNKVLELLVDYTLEVSGVTVSIEKVGVICKVMN